MKNPIEHYWQIRLGQLKQAMEANNFEVFLARNAAEVKEIVQREIIPKTGARSVSWGGSATFTATGLYDVLKGDQGFEVLDVFNKRLTPEEKTDLRRRALFVDLFITGTNAVTETGLLVNLDMVGNRVAGIAFGPKYVVILVGRNKIVPDLDEALFRIKNYAAPCNAMRLEKKTPCVKTASCEECSSPDRICNTWTITEKSYPKARIKVVLINEDLGL
jgi:L-lactate utilization protein LutB